MANVWIGDDLLDLLEAYVAQRIGFEPVRQWLASHVQAVANTRDEDFEDFVGTIWTIMSEQQYENKWSDDEVRSEIRALL